MSAEVLRRAAALMRQENALVEQKSRCCCEDDGETFTDHWFDRTICPEPCGSMHDVCNECGYPKGGCLVMAEGLSNGARLSASWLAVADWLDDVADDLDEWDGLRQVGFAGQMHARALAVAITYLGEQS